MQDVRGMLVQLVISDPWDLVTEMGSGPFRAEVIDAQRSTIILAVLLKLKRPWRYEGSLWEYLVASPRHTGDTLDDAFARSSTVHVNAHGLQGAAADWERLSANWRGGLAVIADLTPLARRR